LAEEEEFLRPWAEQAEKGGAFVRSPIRRALAQKLGRKVSRSVLGRFSGRRGWRKVAPGTRHLKSDPQVQESWEKSPTELAALLNPAEVRARWVCLMFQDEARFGRMVRIRRCWSPFPLRPEVDNGYERQFVFV